MSAPQTPPQDRPAAVIKEYCLPCYSQRVTTTERNDSAAFDTIPENKERIGAGWAQHELCAKHGRLTGSKA